MNTQISDANSLGQATYRPAAKHLGRLRWLTIILAIGFLVCVQGVAMGLVMPHLGIAYGHILSVTAYSVGVIVFTITVFSVIDRMQARIVQKNEELEAINAVSRAVAGSLDSERTMGLALENVMAISGSLAGDITIHGSAARRPRRFCIGDAALLERLDGEFTAGASDRTSAPDQRNQRIVRIPLTGLGEEIGMMRLLPDEESPLSGSLSAGLLDGIGAQIAMAVMAGQLHEDVLRRQVSSEALYEIAVDITSAQDPKDVLYSIAARARELLDADSANVCLYDESRSTMSPAARSGHDVGHDPHTRITGVARTLDGATQSARFIEGHPPFQCPMSDCADRRRAPLMIESDCIGDLCVAGAGIDALDEEAQHLLAGIADLAAIAVQKSRLLERSHRAAALEEREWLARELHDSLAQVLGYLHLKSQAALGKLSRNALAQVEDELQEMAQLAKEGYTDVREAILGLRETTAPSVAFVDVLRDYVQKFGRRAGVVTDLDVKASGPLRLSPDAEVQLIRVVQEALTNVRKHAQASRAQVCLDQADGLTITIEDDGSGFEPERLMDDGNRFGLWTMRERAERVGGLVEIDSAPGRGTRVRVVIPAGEE